MAKVSALDCPGQYGDAPAVAHAKHRRNVRGVDELNAFALYKRAQPFQVLSGIARDFAYLGQIYAVGPRNIEDIDVAESKQGTFVLPEPVSPMSRMWLDSNRRGIWKLDAGRNRSKRPSRSI